MTDDVSKDIVMLRVDPVSRRLLVDAEISGSVVITDPIAVTQSGTWTVGRTWTLDSSTDSITVTQETSPWVVSGTVAATQSGSWSVGRTWTLSSGTDSIAVTGSVSISGTVAVTQSGTWTTARSWTLSSGTDSVTVTGSVTVSGTTTISGTVSTKTALTPASPTAATVGVTSSQAVASNANRKGLVLINTSNNIISLGFGATAVLNSGITLVGRGATFVMDEYTFNTGDINAIASSASSNLTIQEYT